MQPYFPAQDPWVNIHVGVIFSSCTKDRQANDGTKACIILQSHMPTLVLSFCIALALILSNFDKWFLYRSQVNFQLFYPNLVPEFISSLKLKFQLVFYKFLDYENSWRETQSHCLFHFWILIVSKTHHIRSIHIFSYASLLYLFWPLYTAVIL